MTAHMSARCRSNRDTNNLVDDTGSTDSRSSDNCYASSVLGRYATNNTFGNDWHRVNLNENITGIST